MAEGDGKVYRTFKEDVMAGIHNLDTGGNTLKLMLVTGYTPNTATHNVYTDVSGFEVTGAGYVAKGKTLTSQAVTETGTGTGTAGERGKFDAENVTWTGLNIGSASGSPSHAILFNDTPTSPADPLICYWEVTTATNGGNYTLTFNTNGILILYGGN